MKTFCVSRTNWRARKTASPLSASDTTTRSRTTTRTSDSSRTIFLRAGRDSGATTLISLPQKRPAKRRRYNFQRQIDRREAAPIRISFRIGMPGEDGKGAVELFGEHGARQFVRERQGGKRKFLRGAPAQCVRKTLRGAAKKNNFTRAAVARFAQPLRKLRRGLMLSRVVEQNHGRGGVQREFAE